MKNGERETHKLVRSIWPDYELTRTKNGHFRIDLFGEGDTVTLFNSGTPSDHRSLKNFTGDLRRAVKTMIPRKEA